MVLTHCAHVGVCAFVFVSLLNCTGNVEMWSLPYTISTVTLGNKDHHLLFPIHCVNPIGGFQTPLLDHSWPYLRPSSLYFTVFI